jgi:zinc/manganese transport system substrate-binding protein
MGVALVTTMVLVLSVFVWGATGTGESRSPLIVSGVSQWAALAHQLVGPDATVVGLLSDPNADPHDHEATVADAEHVASASIVVVNGAGYDTWLQQLVDTSGQGAHTIDVATIMNVAAGNNPHIFYNPKAAIRFVQTLTALLARRPGFANLDVRSAQLLGSLDAVQARVDEIRSACAGVKVAATEDVTTYLLHDAGLNVVTPEALRLAVGNGVDPSVATLALALDQLREHPAFLIDNVQTSTPLTGELVAQARRSGVPVIKVTETMRGTDYVRWITTVIATIERSLMREGCWK